MDDINEPAKKYLAERGISANFDRVLAAGIIVELRSIRQYLEKLMDDRENQSKKQQKPQKETI